MKPVIVYGPQGCGKTRNAERLRDALGLTHIVDGYNLHPTTPQAPPMPGTLYLTNQTPVFPMSWAEVMHYDDAMKLVEGAKRKFGATALVRVTVEVPVGPWGNDCTVAQIFQQAEREGLERVRGMVAKVSGARIIGDAEVVATVGEKKG